MLRIIIAHDYAIAIEGLRKILLQEKTIITSGEASNGKEVISLLKKKRKPDIILADFDLPMIDGVQLTKIVHEQYDDVKVLLMLDHLNMKNIHRMLIANPHGAIEKNVNRDELIAAISSIHDGKKYFSWRITEMMADIISKQERLNGSTIEPTDLDKQILRGIAKGKSSAAIAKELNFSKDTIDSHRKKLLRQYNATNTAELISIITLSGVLL